MNVCPLYRKQDHANKQLKRILIQTFLAGAASIGAPWPAILTPAAFPGKLQNLKIICEMNRCKV
mgnify:CR=1 FL=1